MLKKLFKIKKTNKFSDSKQHEEEVLEEIEEIKPEEQTLPPIKLFLSLEQLNILKTPDEDRFMQAQMFLLSKEKKEMDPKLTETMDKKFHLGFGKLGNEHSQCPHCKRAYQSAPSEVKKCLGCEKAFFKTKRPQDGMTVLVREEDREKITLQWENIKKAEQIEGIGPDQLEGLRLQLQQRDKRKYTTFDAHFMYLRDFVSRAIKTGRFRLYSSLVYYMAEHDRYRQAFTVALSHYFYIYFLHLNGASNSVVFGDQVSVNPRIKERILSLLKMANIQSKECEEFFLESIRALTAFDLETLPFSPQDSYEQMKEDLYRFETFNTPSSTTSEEV